MLNFGVAKSGPDREFIRQEIAAQLKPLIAEIRNQSSSKGWKRVPTLFKEWGLMSVPLGMLAIIISLIVALVANYRSTEHRLTVIESKLLNQAAIQAPSVALRELASLDAKKLAMNLPALRIISEQPVSKVLPQPSELHTVAYNLSKVDSNTGAYWETVLLFIEFASSHFASNAPPPGSPVNVHLSKHTSGVAFASPMVIEIDGDVIEDETFTDSRIVFTGKPSVLKNVRFVNCAFEFPKSDKPTPFLEAAGRQILDAGIQTASISGL